MNTEEAKEAIKWCGLALAEKGLVWGHSGNISIRLNSEAFLISAGGTDLGCLTDADMVVCYIVHDRYEGTANPSMETGLHRGIYQSCPQAAAIIHSQPFYSTLVACSDIDVRTDFLPEAMSYLGSIVRVPYHHAGSTELAEASAEAAMHSQVMILDNHGVVCQDESLKSAALKTEALEFACRLLVTSRASGTALKYLGETVAKDFLKHLKDIGR